MKRPHRRAGACSRRLAMKRKTTRNGRRASISSVCISPHLIDGLFRREQAPALRLTVLSFKQKSKRTALGGGTAADFPETENRSFCFNGNGAKRPRFGKSFYPNYIPALGGAVSFKQKSKRAALVGGIAADFSETKNHSFCFNGNGAKRFALGEAISIITPQPKKSTKNYSVFPSLSPLSTPEKAFDSLSHGPLAFFPTLCYNDSCGQTEYHCRAGGSRPAIIPILHLPP